MKSVLSFISEVRLELTKVTWPKRADVARLTLIVLLVSAGFGLYVGGLDFAFTKALEVLVSK